MKFINKNFEISASNLLGCLKNVKYKCQQNKYTKPLRPKHNKKFFTITFAKSLRFFYSRILCSDTSFGGIVRKEIRTRPIKWRDKASCRPVVASNNDLFAAKLVIKYLCLFMPPLKVIERKSTDYYSERQPS